MRYKLLYNFLMDLSLVLARFWGLALIALCGPFLVNKRALSEVGAVAQPEFVYKRYYTIRLLFTLAVLTSFSPFVL